MKTRREFFGSSGLLLAGATVSLAGGERRSAGPRPARLTMIIDLDRCTGCQACVIACAASADTAPRRFNTRLLRRKVKGHDRVRSFFMPVQCNQCEKPPCVAACPVDATFRLANGIVVTDWGRCTGCGSCVAACPYDARFADPRYGNRVDKCDFCQGRLAVDLVPACVEACSAGARLFGDRTRPQGEFGRYLRTRRFFVRRPEEGTRPSVLYVAGGDTKEGA